MRRILIDRARKRQVVKHGGHMQRVELLDPAAVDSTTPVDLVKLRYFAGLTVPQAAAALGIASSTADKYWAYAKVWLRTEMKRLSEADD